MLGEGGSGDRNGGALAWRYPSVNSDGRGYRRRLAPNTKQITNIKSKASVHSRGFFYAQIGRYDLGNT